jgi:ribonuclease BN (tRNA processing enzyme)
MKRKVKPVRKKAVPKKAASVPVKKAAVAKKLATTKGATKKKAPAKRVVAKKPLPRKAAGKKPAPAAIPLPFTPLQQARLELLHAAHVRPASSTSLVMLGTGMPRPDPMCFGPATAVTHGGRTFLFDAGAGVMRRMAAARLSIRGPDALFITHLHSDHTLGLPDVILTTWVMGRREKLAIYGPVGTKHMTSHILTAWKEDIHVRIHGLEHNSKDGYRVKVHEFDEGVVYDQDGVRITAIPVEHGCWKQAYGFRIDTPERSIVISGDTKPCKALLEAARGVDVLVHEVYPSSQVAPEVRVGGESWPSYMHEFHTSDRELGMIAAIAQPKLLVLHHIVRHGSDDEELANTIRAAGYTGEIVVARDLDRY